MSNFKIMISDIEVNDVKTSEIDEHIMLLIEFKESDLLKNFLRKCKNNKFVDLYLSGKLFNQSSIVKQMFKFLNIEIIAFDITAHTVIIKTDFYDLEDIRELRKMKIDNILNI